MSAKLQINKIGRTEAIRQTGRLIKLCELSIRTTPGTEHKIEQEVLAELKGKNVISLRTQPLDVLRNKLLDRISDLTTDYFEAVIGKEELFLILRITRGLYDLCNAIELMYEL